MDLKISGMTCRQYRSYLTRAIRDMKAISAKMDKAYNERIASFEAALADSFEKMRA